jgi:hypothetical protein
MSRVLVRGALFEEPCRFPLPCARTFVLQVPGTDSFVQDEAHPCLPPLSNFLPPLPWGRDLSDLLLDRKGLIGILGRALAFHDRINETNKTDKRTPLRQAAETWRTQLVLREVREQMAARSIQRQFRKAVSTPTYGLCQKRLLGEFEDLVRA